MSNHRPFANALELLRAAKLRPTRQRLALAKLLFEKGDRHVTAEQLHDEALAASIPVSLATIYNTLHQFVGAGLLREVVVNPGRSYFDTNIADHHHFFFEETGKLHGYPERPDRGHRSARAAAWRDPARRCRHPRGARLKALAKR